jgi:hypothetical protein
MRVFCCYTGTIHPKAAEALKRFAPDCEYVETLGLYGYNEALASLWTGESDLLIIEGDKEITAEVLPSMESCTRHWCTYQYDIFPPPCTRKAYNGLGCTKYSARVQQVVHPSEWMETGATWEPCRRCGGKGCYRYIDSRINRAIERNWRLGVQPHIHGEILHHHNYDAEFWRQEKLDQEYYNSKILEMKIDPTVFEPLGDELCE